MSITLNSHEIDVGSKVKFNTLAASDPVVWLGFVEAVASYQVAKIVSDVARTHEEVKKTVPALGDLTTMTYLIIATTDTGDPSQRIAFAIDWIDESTVELITVGTQMDIRIFDEPIENLANILTLLAENGYKAKSI